MTTISQLRKENRRLEKAQANAMTRKQLEAENWRLKNPKTAKFYGFVNRASDAATRATGNFVRSIPQRQEEYRRRELSKAKHQVAMARQQRALASFKPKQPENILFQGLGFNEPISSSTHVDMGGFDLFGNPIKQPRTTIPRRRTKIKYVYRPSRRVRYVYTRRRR